MSSRSVWFGSSWQKPVSRRTALVGLGTAVGAVVVGGGAGGCGGSSKEVVTVPSPTGGAKGQPTAVPKRGGTATFAMATQMSDLQPQMAGAVVNYYVFDHLFVNDSEGRRYLSLAQSFEQPDALTYIFKLKLNAKHHNLPPVNGRNVTSHDVVASWEAFVANPRTGNKAVFTDVVDSYQTPDASTLIIKAKKAYAWTMSSTHLGGVLPTVVVPKELIDQNLLGKIAVGPGAYILEQFDPTSMISFVRRPDAWHSGDERPYIDKKVYRVITDPATRVAAFKAKQIDALAPRDKLQAEEFKTFGPGMVVEMDPTGGMPNHLFMRSDPEGGLFADVRVREAVYSALDIQEVIDTVEMGDGFYSGPVPTYDVGWVLPQDELKKYFPHDVAKAKQLLAAAGWDSNREVEFKHPAREKDALFCQIIQKQLAQVGIKTRLSPQDYNAIWTTVTIPSRDFQLAGIAYQYVLSDPNTALMMHTSIGRGAGNQQRWSDPEVDAIVAKQQGEFDLEKQRQIILDAQRLLFKKFTPWVVVNTPVERTAHWNYYHPAEESGKTGNLAVTGHYDWTEKP